MTRHLPLTAVEAQAFNTTPAGETFWLVREGLVLDGTPIRPPTFVQACAFCNACDARLWDHGQNRKTDCPDCRIELVGPCPACMSAGVVPHGEGTTTMYRCSNGTVTLGHAYAVGQPLPISDVWPDKPPADGLMFLPTGRAAYHKASRPTFWLPGQSKGTEFSLHRLAHYGPPETLVGQWAIALRRVQS